MNLKKWMIRKDKINYWKKREKDQMRITKKIKEQIIWLI
jgi:hypothetical protein